MENAILVKNNDMPIEIKEVLTSSDRNKFVRLPFEIYKGNEFWVPSMNKDELHNINPEENTVDFVVMFIPNEMIFSFIYERFDEFA